MELLTNLMTLFMGSNYSREKILRRFSFTEFWEKLKTLPEIVCPMHDEFVRFDSKNECIEPVDDIIDKVFFFFLKNYLARAGILK